MKRKQFFKRILAGLLIVAMSIPAVYLGQKAYTAAASDVESDDILKVVAQATQGVVSDGGEYDGKYVFRFTSSLDTLDYDAVGFEVTDGTTKKTATTRTVYKRIASTTAGVSLGYNPKIVDAASEYFFTAKLGVAEANVETNYTIRAFYVLNGVRTYGPSKCLSVADCQAGVTSVNLSFKLDSGAAAPSVGDVIYANGIAVTVIDVRNDYVHTKTAENMRATMETVTKITFTSDAAGSVVLGEGVHRNFSTNFAETEIADTSWYDAYADEDLAYVITTAAELYGLATLVHEGNTFAGRTIYLAGDITLNEGDAAEWNAGTNVDTLTPWVPIGGNGTTNSFAGTFDGQGHTISGLYMKDGKLTSGLFGRAAHGSLIQNVRLTNSYIEGTAYVGSFVGKTNGSLKNLYSDAYVVSNSSGHNTGGIAAEVVYETKEHDVYQPCEVTGCWFAGALVSTNNRAGGIAGAFYPAGSAGTGATLTMADCLVTGTIDNQSTSADAYTGGVVGYAVADATTSGFVIERCITEWSKMTNTSLRRGAVIGKTGTTGTVQYCYCIESGDWAGSPYGSGNGNLVYDKEIALRYVGKEILLGDAAYTRLSGVFDFCTAENEDGIWCVAQGALPRLTAFPDNNVTYLDWYYNDADANGGDGDGVFYIDTAEELYSLADIAADYNFTGKTIKLTADIVLNTGDAADWFAGTNAGETWWTPIPNFDGTFDGQGHTISGLKSTSGGMFAYAGHNSLITNFKLANSYVGGNGPIGSIVNQAKGSLSRIYSDAYVQVVGGGMGVGGLVGKLFFEKAASDELHYIQECWFAGTITSSVQQIGGLVGYLATGSDVGQREIKITNCLVTAQSIQDTGANTWQSGTGGLIGWMTRTTLTIQNCIVNTSAITSTNHSYVGALIGNDEYGSASSQYANLRTITACVGLLQKATPVDWNANLGETNYKQQTLTGINAYDSIKDTYSLNTSSKSGVWTITDGSPALTRFSDAKIDVAWYYEDADAAGGTGDGKFSIKTADELYSLPHIAKSYDFSGKTIQLEKNITMNSGKASEWKDSIGVSDIRWWTPIGTSDKPFAGTFDGQGHTISGVFVMKQDIFAGLFGYAAHGSLIKNTKLVNSCIRGTAYVGSFAGKSQGSFENLYSNAYIESTLTTKPNTGGIVGEAVYETTQYDAYDMISITGCWFDGSISSQNPRTGGIAGSLYAVQVGNGTPLKMEDCLVTGSIQNVLAGSTSCTGGLIGLTEEYGAGFTIERCIVDGTVITGTYEGAFIGRAQQVTSGTSRIIKNCYTVADTEGTVTPYYTAAGTISASNVKNVLRSTLVGMKGYSTLCAYFGIYAESNMTAANWVVTETGLPKLAKLTSDKTTYNYVQNSDVAWYYEDADAFGGSGDNQFDIDTAEEFCAFSEISKNYDFAGKTVKLKGSITLDASRMWTPIATGSAFAGVFDGEENTISGIYLGTSPYYYSGVFAKLSSSGEIKNLQLGSTTIEMAAGGATGSAVGSVVGFSYGNLSNLKSAATITAGGSATVGGIVGIIETGEAFAYGTNDSCIDNGWFSGKITTTGMGNTTGGIVGNHYNTAGYGALVTQIRDCYVNGTITCTNTTRIGDTGGIVGALTDGRHYITRCLVNGTMKKESTANGYAGCIIGFTGDTYIQNSYARTQSGLGTTAEKMAGWEGLYNEETGEDHRVDVTASAILTSRVSATNMLSNAPGLFVADTWDTEKLQPLTFKYLDDDADLDGTAKPATTFSAYTNVKAFQEIPIMVGGTIGTVTDYGLGDYIVEVTGTTEAQYDTYLSSLVSAGFVKHSDNAENTDGYARTAAFEKGKLTVVVSHMIKNNITYISARYDQELSEHLDSNNVAKYTQNLPSGAKTKLHLFELANNGTALIIQLKNGHFVIHDGGNPYDAPYLLDYLKKLAPAGEKPVVEGWFISHPHEDHYGSLKAIAENSSYAEQIIVNGVYFHIPHTKMHPAENEGKYSKLIKNYSYMLTSEDGGKADFHRMQYGQRYYFCDVKIDILLTPEQLDPSTFDSTTYSDGNDTSVWYMNYIEGKKILFNGDTEHRGQEKAVSLYAKSYFNLEFYVVPHHGINVYDYMTSHISSVKNLLYPSFRCGSLYHESCRSDLAAESANSTLKAKATGGTYCHREGTTVFTFNAGGTYSVANEARCTWSHNGGTPPKGATDTWGWDNNDVFVAANQYRPTKNGVIYY